MSRPLRALVLEDCASDAELIVHQLRRSGFEPEWERVETETGYLAGIQAGPDIILADYRLPGLDALRALWLLDEHGLDIPLIVITGAVSEEVAAACVREGAADYLLKDRLRHLGAAVSRALREREAREEKRRTEAALRESEERFRRLAENAQDLVYRVGLHPTPRYEYVSSAATAMTGYTPEELYADPDIGARLIHPEDRPLLEAALHSPSLACTTQTIRLRHKDGHLVWTEHRCALLRDEEGRPVAIEGIARDITARRQAELEREATVELLRLVNESISSADLVQAAAGFLQRQSGCEAVGIRLREGDDYPYFEARGFPQEFVQAENSLCARDDAGEPKRDSAGNPVLECMCGNVICGRFDPSKPFFTPGGSFWTNCTTELLAGTTEADRQGRTRNRCNGQGYESVALIPLRAGEERMGLLQLNDRRRGLFTSEIIVLWERLAAHLAVGLAKLRAEETVLAREAELRLVTDAVPALISHIDSEGRYRLVNVAYERRFGLSAKQVQGRRAREIAGDEAWQGVRPYVERAMAGETVSYERRMPLAGGEGWVHVTHTPDRDQGGRVRGYVTHVVDIEERKRAEDALRHAHQRTESVLAGMADTYVLLDREWRYLDVNEAAARSMGRERDQIIGHTLWELYPDTAGTELDRQCRRAMDEGLAATFDYHHSATDTWWENRLSPTPHGLAVFATDITERKRAEEARTRLAAILEATTDLVGVADAHGRVLSINRAGRLMLGLGEAEDVSSMEIWQFCTAATYDVLTTEAGPAAVREGVWQGDTVLVARDGREVPVSQLVIAHRSPDGGIESIATIARDLSRRRQLEEELRHAQKMEAVGRLAGGVAHDFNNLLMPMMAYSHMLCDSLDPGSEAHDFALEIANAVDRSAGLPRQLLAFSRKQIIQPQVLDLNETVADVQKMLRRLIGEDITLVAIPGADLGKVNVDPGQIEQVLVNLAVNACDAMPDGGYIVIETMNADLDESCADSHVGVRPGRWVVLAMTDTGCGMDKETQARIFEPFFTTKEPGKGTGLGLSTAYGIVKQSNGEIRVYSEPQGGTTFRIYLPRVDEPAGGAEEGPAPTAPPDGTEVVLLVEDDAGVRAATRAILEHGGYTVLLAGNGEDGLLAAQRHSGPIHLLLTDVVMPQMSGRQLAEQSARQRPQTRVLFMSGHADDAIVRHGMLEEGIAFIQKPFSPHALLHKVREVLDRRA